MPAKPNPIPLAMIICDLVIEDRLTGKKSLIGLFDDITAKKVPTTHSSLNVYVALTEGHGSYEIKLKCLAESDVVLELGGPVLFKNPHQIVEWNFTLRNLHLPKYGKYRFDLLCNDKLVISKKFKVSPITK